MKCDNTLLSSLRNPITNACNQQSDTIHTFYNGSLNSNPIIGKYYYFLHYKLAQFGVEGIYGRSC